MIKITVDKAVGQVLLDGTVGELAGELNSTVLKLHEKSPELVECLFLPLVDAFGEDKSRQLLENAILAVKATDGAQAQAEDTTEEVFRIAREILKELKKERTNEHNRNRGKNYKKTRGKNNEHRQGNV